MSWWWWLLQVINNVFSGTSTTISAEALSSWWVTKTDESGDGDAWIEVIIRSSFAATKASVLFDTYPALEYNSIGLLCYFEIIHRNEEHDSSECCRSLINCARTAVQLHAGKWYSHLSLYAHLTSLSFVRLRCQIVNSSLTFCRSL